MGEMGPLFQDPLVMDSHNTTPGSIRSSMIGSRSRGHSSISRSSNSSYGSDIEDVVALGLGSPKSIAISKTPEQGDAPQHLIQDRPIKRYLEMWDYKGGAKFRGFETIDGTLVVFFDHDILDKDLKQGLMALIELASTDHLACEWLMICLNRNCVPNTTLMRDLRWVGFEPATLERWALGAKMTSDRWVFLGMDI